MIANESINIFIVDDHPFIVEGLQMVIDRNPPLHVSGIASSIQETKQKIKNCKPDILIADMQINDESGIDLIKAVKKILPRLKVLMISMHSETYLIEKSLQAGANGYIFKSESTTFLIDALHAIYSGQRYLSPDVERKLLNKALGSNSSEYYSINIEILTVREKEIIKLYGKGKSAKEIAEIMHISKRTVDSHKENIRQKLNKKTMKEVLELAIEWTNMKVV